MTIPQANISGNRLKSLHTDTRKNIIVLGASAGGVEAVGNLLRRLPAELDAAIFVVVHTAPSGRGLLASVLQRSSPLPVSMATDGESISLRHVYVAPPDHHMLLADGQIRVTCGPKENHTRPAIDPLFRSAALDFGPRVVGVILTGLLHDGSAGLHAVQLLGGTCIVQDPRDALHADMPRNAIRRVPVEYVLGADDIPALLVRLAKETTTPDQSPPIAPERVVIETRIALGDNAMSVGVMGLGPATPYTCPECNGVLLQLKEEGFVRFRCHTGHAFSAASLVDAGDAVIENSLWNSVRTIEERVILLRHIASHARNLGDEPTALSFETQATAMNARAKLVRQLATESTHVENVVDEAYVNVAVNVPG